MISMLIVDDALFMRKLIRDALEPLGYRICGEAADGNEAIARYRELRPDITTLDIVMPNADGLAALAGIRQINPTAKVIMVTAVDQRESMRRAVELGICDFIVKPFDADRIIGAVEKAAQGLPLGAAETGAV
jgi:two-component system chemotaxis response regulator CheY